MAEIYVGSSEALRGIIEDLTTANSTYLEQAEAVEAEQKNLTSKWEGEASTSFQDRFSKEQHCYHDFYEGIATYIKALQEILERYEAAETQNTNIAAQ